jgi:hypothetical protein
MMETPLNFARSPVRELRPDGLLSNERRHSSGYTPHEIRLSAGNVNHDVAAMEGRQ